MQPMEIRRFVTAAHNAGATDTTLEPLTRLLDRIQALKSTLAETYNLPTAATDLLTSNRALDLQTLTKEAEAYNKHQGVISYMEDGLRQTEQAVYQVATEWKNNGGVDQALADVQDHWHHYNNVAQQVADKWGAADPDPSIVAAVATPKELKTYQEFVEGKELKKNIDLFLGEITPKPGIAGTDFFTVIGTITDDDRERQDGKTNKRTDFFWREDGELGDTQHARRTLNQIRAAREAHKFINGLVFNHGRLKYKPTYLIATAHKDTADFDRDGLPLDKTHLETHNGLLDRLGIPVDWNVLKTQITRDITRPSENPPLIRVGNLKPFTMWEIKKRLEDN